MTDRLGVYGMLLFAVVAWGGSFVAARAVLVAPQPGAATLSPTALATLRFLLASAVFLPLLRRERRARPLTAADALGFLWLGQLGISGYFWLQYTGLALTNAGVAAVLVVGLIPLATLLLSSLALGEPLGLRRVAALALGALGVGVVVSQRPLDVALESGFLLGALCLVANAFCFAAYSTAVRGSRRRHSSLTTTGGTMLAGTLGLLALTAATGDGGELLRLAPAQWLAVLYLALVCSVAAYFLYNRALARLEASKSAAWLYLEPPVAVLLAALLLGEPVAPQTVLGGLVILASLYLTQRA